MNNMPELIGKMPRGEPAISLMSLPGMGNAQRALEVHILIAQAE